MKKLLKALLVGALGALAFAPSCKREQSAAPAATRGADAPLAVKRGLLIASGLGSIDGLAHTNSIEALRCNYRRGFRWFEVDLSTSVEGELVSFHEGDEKVARLPDLLSTLSIADIEKRKYADRFPIVSFSKLLKEADGLGDVVLVIDADGWPAKLEHAVSRALGYGPKHTTKILFQVFGESDLERVAPLSKELAAGVLLNLRHTQADDARIEELAKKNAFLAVVTPTARFTPWLAERLHAAQLPVLVQNVNEHRDIVNLTRAGADGFFTDRYLPYDRIAEDPTVAMECGATKPSGAELHNWTERDMKRQSDYRLPSCAKRKATRIEFADCDEHGILRTSPLAVPAAQTLHIELEVEAGSTPSAFWLELGQARKPNVLRQRETVTLKANERKTLNYDVSLADGSQGAEVRLGVSSKKDTLVLHRLVAYHGEKTIEAASPTGGSPEDAGE